MATTTSVMNTLVVGDCVPAGHPGDISKSEAAAGILPSHGISIDVAGTTDEGRPPIVHHLSMPAYHSPLRHHRRNPSQHRHIPETLDARSEFLNNEEDGRAEHHINQYIIKDEIGRGSFGAVHLAVDQYGTEYAVKEFSKSRLRKRAQSNILRRPHHDRRLPGHLAAGGFNSPLHRHSASDLHRAEEQGNPLYLIKEEIAIMKKLDHPNLVQLIEVLDDPEEDSLYMVLEMCKKGVVMKVGLGEKADPYDSERCRHWFRDLILGIEYLHAQGVAHRDIKPDNLLLTEDDVLKIVDFGVSEMFEKASDMMTAKSAGSPAFLPPELCVMKHGDISGKAADIWSMGVSLYCLKFGKIPFECPGVLELYESIKNDSPHIDAEHEPEFCDLMGRLLEKDPQKRIKMPELREHPWVTKDGTDPLLSTEENTADLVEPPSKIEINHAVTAKMRNLIVMTKAVGKFKALLEAKRPAALGGSLGKGIRTLHNAFGVNGTTPEATQSAPTLHKTRSADLHDRRKVETGLAAEGVHHDVQAPDAHGLRSMNQRMDASVTMIDMPKLRPQERIPSQVSSRTASSDSQQSGEGKGHAHDPLDEEPLFLGIGTGSLHDPSSTTPPDPDSLTPPRENIIAESPTAAEFSIYDTAYQEEVDRIRAAQGRSATIYLTRRIDKKEAYKKDENMINLPTASQVAGQPHEGWKGLVDKAREKTDEPLADISTGKGFGDIAAKAMENTKVLGRELKSGKDGTGGFDGLVQKALDMTHSGKSEVTEEQK